MRQRSLIAAVVAGATAFTVFSSSIARETKLPDFAPDAAKPDF